MKRGMLKLKTAAVCTATAVLAVVLGAGCGSPQENKAAPEETVSVQETEKVPEAEEPFGEIQGVIEETAPPQTLEEQVEQYLGDMTLEEKVAQLFVITPEAITHVETVTAAGETTRKAMEEYPVGGFVYMKANLVSESQTRKMLGNVQEYAQEITGLPVFLSVDEEGGTVARVAKNDGFSVEDVGDMADIGASGDTGKAYEVGETIGTYLSDLGFNLDFAPDADVLTNPDNAVIGVRSFGSDSQLVSDMVLAEMDGLSDAGVLSCVKHFPGHGGTAGDTHEGYAYTDKTLDELKAAELVPFAAAVEAEVPFVMVSHISVPQVIGDNTPSSLSETMVSEVLRDQLGYDGIVITDALNMGAIAENYSSSEAAVRALSAGVDMLLMPADFESAYNGVLQAVEDGTLSEARIDDSVRRILQVKLSV